MAKRGRDDISSKPGALDELCPNIKRLHLAGSENLEAAVNLANNNPLESSKAAHVDSNPSILYSNSVHHLGGGNLAAVGGEGHHQRTSPPLEGGGGGAEQAVQPPVDAAYYAEANNLLRQMHLERLARLNGHVQ